MPLNLSSLEVIHDCLRDLSQISLVEAYRQTQHLPPHGWVRRSPGRQPNFSLGMRGNGDGGGFLQTPALGAAQFDGGPARRVGVVKDARFEPQGLTWQNALTIGVGAYPVRV